MASRPVDGTSYPPCSIGTFLQAECHKTIYSPVVTNIVATTFTDVQKELLLWRTGIEQQGDLSNVCNHHKIEYLDRYESYAHLRCCDPFKRHTKAIKRDLRVVSLDLAKQFREILHVRPTVIPGQKLCSTCRKHALSEISSADQKEANKDSSDENNSEVKTTSDEGTEVEAAEDTEELDKLNTSLTGIDDSPMKMHSLAPHQKVSYGKRKIKAARQNLRKKVARVLHVPEEKLRKDSSSDDESIASKREEKQKANDLDRLVELMKEKLPTVSRREKIRILTFAPPSWTREKIQRTFGVSQRMVREASEILNTKGICSLPDPKQGRKLPNETVLLVRNFYEDDEYSRLMPGTKDYVSIKKNVHAQKRLILSNLEELYATFKQIHPNIKLGFSKFCQMRPKWCVLAGSSGTHAVCVCTIHQNVDLLLRGLNLNTKDDVNSFIDKIVCSKENRDCMLRICDKCPPSTNLTNYIETKFQLEEDDEINFHQWVSVDRTQLIDMTLPFNEFTDMLVTKLETLVPHGYIAKSQAAYLKERKNNINENEALVLMDFAENYGFVLQDAAQSYHWTHMSCTIHPAVIYYKNPDTEELCHLSLCYISDDLNHDVAFVYKIQSKIVESIKHHCPTVNKIEYFTDGCSAQYKNCKSFLNLCHHEVDFGITATWSFFATSHGKSPCDGIGGSVKRMVTKANLQRPYKEQISDPKKMFEFCKEKFSKIHFFYIEEKEVSSTRTNLQQRFTKSKTVAGTRSFHQFIPLSTNTLAAKRVSSDNNYALQFNFSDVQTPIADSLKVNSFVCCKYDSKWYIGLIEIINLDQGDARIRFMHPAGPSVSFYWPDRVDICWIPFQNILCTIEQPTTMTGRQYQISVECQKLINEKWNNL